MVGNVPTAAQLLDRLGVNPFSRRGLVGLVLLYATPTGGDDAG